MGKGSQHYFELLEIPARVRLRGRRTLRRLMHDDNEPIGSAALRRRGDVIGGSYLLGQILGIGGMGVVYEAIQRSLGRTVALKLPRPELVSDPIVRERFRIEARAGSRINHPNVVHILDFCETGGVPYLVMEHVPGRRLGDLVVERGGLPTAFAVEIIGQILAGLQDAHANGIVHSDVKCDNILVQTVRDGRVVPRLIDFGIAHFVGGADARGAGTEDIIVGTPEYLAPELIRGDPPTFASDVYAAGVLLYELMTGATPFAGGTQAQVLSRQLREQPMPLSWWAPHRGVPPALDGVVARALAKEPADRFADAGAFGAALACVPAHEPGLRRPITWPTASTEVFSTEATTASLHADAVALAAPSAAPAGPGIRSRVDERRRAVGAALREGDIDAIAIAYLDLARVLLDAHRVGTAIAELEEGVELLSAVPVGASRSPLWRLLLSLAAIYGGRGDRARARAVACAARDQAVAAGSAVGRERAERLWTRLANGDPRVDGAPPAWYRGL